MAAILSTFGVIAAIVILGYITEIIFKKTGIPDVLFLIGTGIFITHLGWVDPASFGFGAQLFATFTLVFLLFQGSLNIEFKTLFQSFSSVAKLTFISFILTIIIGTAILHLVLGFDFILALLTATILGGTSSAVVIPIVNSIESLDKRHRLIMVLESAISDVLCIVGALTIITVIQTGQLDAAGVVKDVLSSFALALFVGTVIGLIWINLVKKSVELKKAYMVTIAVVIALYALVESPLVAASGAIAALAFGLVIGNSRSIVRTIDEAEGVDEDEDGISNVISPSAKTFYAEISFFVKVFFFVYLGTLMSFSNPMIYLWAFILVLAIYLVRPLAVKQSFRKEKLDDRTRTTLEVMVPKGLAAAVLAQLAVSSGIPGADGIVQMVFAVVLISIAFTSVLMIANTHGWFRGLLGFMMPVVEPAAEVAPSTKSTVHHAKKEHAKKK